MTPSIKQILLTVLVALVSIPASAYDFKVGGIYYNVVSLSDLTCEVVAGGSKYTGNVKIPSSVEYKGKTLSVTSIDNDAFYYCESLTSVVIGNRVTSIGEEAFFNCTSLTSVVIPNSVTSIDGGAFSYCTSLTSVVIPNSVTSIGNYAFGGCSSLTSVDIPNSVTGIGESAFEGCSSLTSVVIPNSVTSIDGGAFGYCESLTSVVIPNSVTSIGNYAFSGCTSLTSVVIPNSVTSIGGYAFYKCSSLTSVVIPNSVTSIGYNAFSDCTSLTKVEVGNAYGLMDLLSYAKTLIVAEDYSDTSFPNLTYSNYTKLDTLICKMTIPPTLPATFSNSQYLNLPVIVPTEALATYQATDVWKDFWSLQGGAESYTTTGITTATIDRNNKATTIYDLSGRKLSAPQRGLNIINGKKVLVK